MEIKFKPTHRHRESGKLYILIGVSNLKATRDDQEFLRMAVYLDNELNLWTRPLDRFEARTVPIQNKEN